VDCAVPDCCTECTYKSPSSQPSQFPTISFSSCRSQAVETLSTVSNRTTLLTSGTPQSRALGWLLHRDTFYSCPFDLAFVQRYIMAVFYYSTDGPSWDVCSAPRNLTDPSSIADANNNCVASNPGDYQFTGGEGDAWLTPSHECFWGMVRCRDDDQVVAFIEFDTNRLGGTLPSELQHLNDLRVLRLREGSTSGRIPSEYGTLSSLFLLVLSQNNITGTIPAEIYGLPKLVSLQLNSNHLTGTISTDIGMAASLQIMFLQENFLTGTIPEEMGNNVKLERANLQNNYLSGEMPQDVCDLREPTGSISFLTADCGINDEPRVDCAVPDCCTDCTFASLSF